MHIKVVYDYTTVTEEYYTEFDSWYYGYTFNGGTGTDGLNWDSTLLKCESLYQ